MCDSTTLDVTFTERVVAKAYCSGTTIVNFVTSSPIGMQHSNIVNQGNGMYQLPPLLVFDAILALVGIFVLTLTWTPAQDQEGPQGFCAGALDNNTLQSDAWCITYLVGFDSPDLIRIRAVQGSASPIGTVFSNHSLFSIQGEQSCSKISLSLSSIDTH